MCFLRLRLIVPYPELNELPALYATARSRNHHQQQFSLQHRFHTMFPCRTLVGWREISSAQPRCIFCFFLLFAVHHRPNYALFFARATMPAKPLNKIIRKISPRSFSPNWSGTNTLLLLHALAYFVAGIGGPPAGDTLFCRSPFSLGRRIISAECQAIKLILA